ncbi:metal ABC transporter ATP-binding protein [Paenalcaligenes faecalis]|uniref:metal ABC transporter ATP-binding protein n=1 Tax=Paenalcaligenes faecalis TaxID=2980099 RepID=UPI003D9C699B
MAMSTPIIELEHVSLGWRDKIALRDISGQFEAGGLYALVGPNGAGKSTLLKGLMGEIAPVQGQIRLQVDAMTDLAFLPQQADIDRSFPITVYDVVAMGAWSRIGAWRGVNATEHQRIQQALDTVGLAGFAARSINTLSGGQFQRALFARLLVQDASVILLDEPFAAVDTDTTHDLLRLVLDWHAQGRTVIAVLHELDMVRNHFPTSVLLGGQLVAWGKSQEVLSSENLHLARHLCAGDFL